jgi:hypothetical protein
MKITHQRKRIRYATEERTKHDRGHSAKQNKTNSHDDAENSVQEPANTQDAPMTTQITGR